MQRRLFPFLLACALTAALRAQDLPPELLAVATKYKADTATLEAQKTAEISRLAQVYGASLDAVEKMETTAAHLPAITAIAQEREDLKKNAVTLVLPNNLPKDLLTARKTYLEGVTRITIDIGQRQQRSAADYLRSLATLQTRIGGNSIFAGQIADEKKRVIENGGSVVIPKEFVGVWSMKYDNGHARKYTISPNGVVTVIEVMGHPIPHQDMKIYMQGTDFLIDWPDEDKLERLSMARGHLRVEHFYPKSNYHDRKPPIIGIGTVVLR